MAGFWDTPTPPAAPNYLEAARAQGQANVDAARTQSKLNNPNVYGPYGSQEVTYGGGFDRAGMDAAMQQYEQQKRARDASWTAWDQGGRRGPWDVPEPVAPDRNRFILGDPDQVTVRQTLSPDQQALLDKTNQAKLGLGDLAVRGTGIAQDILGNPLDFSQLPERPDSAEGVRRQAVDAIMARANEDIDRQQNTLNSNLLASGIPPSSKAYQDAMALTERTRTDARNQAMLAGGQEMSRMLQAQQQLRRDALAELLTQRQTPLNELASIREGTQVVNPYTTPGVAQNAQVSAAPLFAANQLTGDWNADLYNVRAAQAGNYQKGLFDLGSAGLMAFGWSDRRLKSKIRRVGTHPLGIGWYEYDIAGRREQGVMAQELQPILPEAVVTLPNGYLAVNYDLIGGRYVSW